MEQQTHTTEILPPPPPRPPAPERITRADPAHTAPAQLDAPLRREAYEGLLAFCLVRGEPDFGGHVFGPQGKRYLPVGELPDGRYIGVAAVFPQELAIIQAAHRDEYVASTWNELLARPEYAPHVWWLVETEEGRWVSEPSLGEADVPARTRRGHRRRRPPIQDGARAFDPDYVPPVGTTRVVPVEGGHDRVQVVATGPDGTRGWYEVVAAPATSPRK